MKEQIEINYDNGIIYQLKNGIIKEVGSKRKDGYKQFRYQGKNVLCHRFIYEQFHNVKLKASEHINHIDLNPSNNAISNLEIVSHQQNQQHRIKNKNSTTGFKNIYHTQDKRNGKLYEYYKVQIMFNGKEVCQKRFNKNNPNVLNLAIEYRDNFIKNLNKKYNCHYLTDESFEILQLMNLYNIYI